MTDPTPRVGASGDSPPFSGAGRPKHTAATNLAARQAALVDSLLGAGPDPEGLDPARLAATRSALLRKRAGEAARHWPLLASALGRDWVPFASEVLAGRPVAGGLRDGWDVARAARDRLGEGALRELAEREQALRYDGASAPRPRLRTRLASALRRRGR
ncbi:hypothetical protein GCM10009836_67550 [Pseudonocardia ailaonensis]|uniref:SCO6045-like C-terminal domain-containing protein n=1 Tax=Pseudonocardia ailaonensis TaxID=367279 RepID=A0ABN2NR63_9PSEU